MKKLFEKHWKELLLITVYIITAIAIYVVWFHTKWHLWYVDILTALAITAIGVAIGIYYIKDLDKEEMAKANKATSEIVSDDSKDESLKNKEGE